VAPVIALSRSGRQTVFPMRWGFGGKRLLINARTETAAERPTFREAWASHRCVIPASWYYEWEHTKLPSGKTKTGDKYAIQPAGCTITWLCGLYRIENGYPVFVVLTKEPTVELSKIHDRMPLMLPKDKIGAWINPSSDPADLLSYALSDMVIEKSED
jgi:putative SOS response-associated peptidase YedK